MVKPTIKLLLAVFLAFSLLLPGIPVAQAQDDASAASEPAPAPVISSPEHPLAFNSDQWMTIQPGEWQWYAFKYSFDNSRKHSSDSNSNSNSSSNNTPSSELEQTPANLRLDADPADGVSLILINGAQVRAWQGGEKLEGFGAATPATDKVATKADLDQFCQIYPDDPVCNGNRSLAQSACENLRNPAATATECHYKTSQSRGYSNWKGTIGASGTYYILVRGNRNATGPIRYKFTFSGEGLTMK